jgi:hypothetical protein
LQVIKGYTKTKNENWTNRERKGSSEYWELDNKYKDADSGDCWREERLWKLN